jgi:hypothetical protein
MKWVLRPLVWLWFKYAEVYDWLWVKWHTRGNRMTGKHNTYCRRCTEGLMTIPCNLEKPSRLRAWLNKVDSEGVRGFDVVFIFTMWAALWLIVGVFYSLAKR